jgi:hypothetical protein
VAACRWRLNLEASFFMNPEPPKTSGLFGTAGTEALRFDFDFGSVKRAKGEAAEGKEEEEDEGIAREEGGFALPMETGAFSISELPTECMISVPGITKRVSSFRPNDRILQVKQARKINHKARRNRCIHGVYSTTPHLWSKSYPKQKQKLR